MSNQLNTNPLIVGNNYRTSFSNNQNARGSFTSNQSIGNRVIINPQPLGQSYTRFITSPIRIENDNVAYYRSNDNISYQPTSGREIVIGQTVSTSGSLRQVPVVTSSTTSRPLLINSTSNQNIRNLIIRPSHNTLVSSSANDFKTASFGGNNSRPNLGSLLLGAKEVIGGQNNQGLDKGGKQVINNLVRNLVQPNDIDDMINFNHSKQKMIVSRIEERLKELGIVDESLLEDVKQSVATKEERELKADKKVEELKAQIEERDIEALKQKLAAVREQVGHKVANIKDLKVSLGYNF